MSMIIGVTTGKSHPDYNFHRVRCLFYTIVTPIITPLIGRPIPTRTGNDGIKIRSDNHFTMGQ